MADIPVRIIGFCCQHAISKEEGVTGKGRMSFEPTVKIVQLPCSSKVDTLSIMKAFEAGADGIFVLGCPDEHCHLLDGNLRARKVVNYTKALLEEIGMEGNRLEMFQLGTPEWQHLGDVARAMTERIQELGKAK
ncbi:MAG: hydrogenase iron-sulfur subunit [Thermodesulfobacteriota bacterium]|nr:hydrogenase iron-sulfur subunit [Thermodesulfobacteriota bacterium]